MKILAIGDFHGKFPKKLEKEAKKCDLVVSVADYAPFSYRKLFFKYSYKQDQELWEVIGKKKMREFIKKDLKQAEKVLKRLNNLKVPVISVIGNLDYTHVHDVFDLENVHKGKSWKWGDKDFFTPLIKKFKNIKRFDYKYVKFKDLVFIGAYGHTFPGNVRSKNYKKYKKKLENLFKKFKKENKKRKVIFVFHNVPYDCKLDVIRDKSALEEVKGKHYGSKLIRRIINRYQPILGIGGHMHENQGKCKINRTTVINTGAAYEGKAAVIDFDEKRGKIKKVQFIK
jgi:Icc-related predicted phosphoesterase